MTWTTTFLFNLTSGRSTCVESVLKPVAHPSGFFNDPISPVTEQPFALSAQPLGFAWFTWLLVVLRGLTQGQRLQPLELATLIVFGADQAPPWGHA
jgi:hypothetical protein